MSNEAVHHSITSEAGPADRTPPRRPRSVRRTTTHDAVRHDGPRGPVTAIARGRDLYTSAPGKATVVAAARVDAVVSSPGGVVAWISADPADDRLAALAGRAASSGFRGAVERALPGEREAGTILYQLLDDLPTALLVGGYAIMASLREQARAGALPRPPRRAVPLQQVDMCSGWVDGGVLVSGLVDGIPPFVEGALAPGSGTPGAAVADAGALDAAGATDALAWHEHPALPPSSMRRRRRVDVCLDGPVARVEAFFRDSYTRPDGRETILHEYTVDGAVELGDLTFTSCVARFGALPWPECPGALASAGRVVGTPVSGLRQRVRGELKGVGTCTHLNDTLRALEDVGALIGVLRSRDG
jgi:hypothetical protein